MDNFGKWTKFTNFTLSTMYYEYKNNHVLWVQELKIWLKLQIPYYNPLNQWLLGATNGHQGQTVIHF